MIRLAFLFAWVKRQHWFWVLALCAVTVWFAIILYRMWLFSPWMAMFFVVAYVLVCGLLAWFNFLDKNGLMT